MLQAICRTHNPNLYSLMLFYFVLSKTYECTLLKFKIINAATDYCYLQTHICASMGIKPELRTMNFMPLIGLCRLKPAHKKFVVFKVC